MVRCLNLVSKQTNTKGNCLGLKYVVVHPFPVCFLTLRSRLGIGSRLCVRQDPWFSLLGRPLVFSCLIVLAARVSYVVVGGCAVPCLRLLQNSSWFVSLSVFALSGSDSRADRGLAPFASCQRSLIVKLCSSYPWVAGLCSSSWLVGVVSLAL